MRLSELNAGFCLATAFRTVKRCNNLQRRLLAYFTADRVCVSIATVSRSVSSNPRGKAAIALDVQNLDLLAELNLLERKRKRCFPGNPTY